MSDAADLISAGRAFLAAQFPATITVDGQGYDCATSGLGTGADLIFSGTDRKARVCFWLDRAAFAAAGKPEPRERENVVVWNGKTYALDEVKRDPAGATINLICLAPEQ